MKTIEIYRYRRDDGGITIDTEKPKRGYTKGIRYIADKGMLLTDGTETRISVDEFHGRIWTEVPDPNAKTETEEENHEEI
ncbi:MAG: hypothetical protein IJW16_02210 [Clostridia bacterium]|nr:hypothetical protein [Clostridia bacterium]